MRHLDEIPAWVYLIFLIALTIVVVLLIQMAPT